MECLRRNIELLTADLLYDRSYMAGLPAVLSHAWLAMCHAELGEFPASLDAAEEALRIAETGDPGYSLIVASAGLGAVCLLKGDLGRAAAALERGMAVDAGALSARAWPFVASTLGATYTCLGRASEAVPLLEQAVERAAAMKLMANHALRLVRLGEALLAAGRHERAYQVAAQAFDQAREHRERGHEAHALRLLGEIHAMRDEPEHDRAEEHYRKALELAEQLAMRPLQAHCRRGLGRLYRRLGRSDEAETFASSACGLFRAMDMGDSVDRADAAVN
jgi:tetratricopeptide (TPR) repeat protein